MPYDNPPQDATMSQQVDPNPEASRTDAAIALLPWLLDWSLTPDGPAFSTHSSDLQPVLYEGQPAMLKLAHNAEERWGGVLMRWWAGDGAARVLAGDTQAVLMERATGSGSLAEMARDGRDAEACRILCGAAKRLHAHTGTPPEGLLALENYFVSLSEAAQRHGGIFDRVWRIAKRLLDAPSDRVPLHGDLHHDNVLDFGPQRGWLVIDPKRVIGERGFDYATMFGDPLDLSGELPRRLGRRLEIVAEASGLPRVRLLQWIVAQQGLSAAWHLEDDEPEEAQLPLSIVSAALAMGVDGSHS